MAVIAFVIRKAQHDFAGAVETRDARRVRIAQHCVGVGDVDVIAQKQHAERLVQLFLEHMRFIHVAVAIAVAQQGDPVDALLREGAGAALNAFRIQPMTPPPSDGREADCATSTSPLGNRYIQRGWSRLSA